MKKYFLNFVYGYHASLLKVLEFFHVIAVRHSRRAQANQARNTLGHLNHRMRFYPALAFSLPAAFLILLVAALQNIAEKSHGGGVKSEEVLDGPPGRKPAVRQI